MTSSPIRFLSNSNTNIPRAYLSDKMNFILIVHKRAEIQRREVNRELRRKNGYFQFQPRTTWFYFFIFFIFLTYIQIYINHIHTYKWVIRKPSIIKQKTQLVTHSSYLTGARIYFLCLIDSYVCLSFSISCQFNLCTHVMIMYHL